MVEAPLLLLVSAGSESGKEVSLGDDFPSFDGERGEGEGDGGEKGGRELHLEEAGGELLRKLVEKGQSSYQTGMSKRSRCG